MENLFWYISFAAGLSVFIYGIYYVLKKRKFREDTFIIAALIELAANWILVLPSELLRVFEEGAAGVGIPEGILASLLKAINLLQGSEYKNFEIGENIIFTNIYSILRILAVIVMIAFMAMFIIRLLSGSLNRLKLLFLEKRPTYIFFGCNEKTFAIAESIIHESSDDKNIKKTGKAATKKNIIFVCGDVKPCDTDIHRISSISGIYLNMPVEDVLKKTLSRAGRLELFLFGENEEENLERLEIIAKALEIHLPADEKNSVSIEAGDIQKFKAVDKAYRLRIFVEIAETPWNLYDDYLERYNIDKRAVLLNFVRTEENYVYNMLLKHSIFDYTIEEDKVRKINVLIVGMNERSFEMLKAVLHLGQMPGHELSVMVLDEGYGRKRLNQLMPEVADKAEKFGDALYTLEYREGVDLRSSDVEDIIENDYRNFTFVFVNTGDDLTNINLAMRINALAFRWKRDGLYRIKVNMTKDSITSKWKKEMLEGIDFVGSFKETYDHDFVSMSDIERVSKAIHYSKDPQKIKKCWSDYYNNEYNRHSVYARTLSYVHKIKIIDKYHNSNYEIVAEKEWMIYEHMRWDMYTRSLGYVVADDRLKGDNGKTDKQLQRIAKVHHDLVNYDQLVDQEQQKDRLPTSEEVLSLVNGLMS